MGEIWKPVKGFEKGYLISNFGRLWSKPKLNGFGYGAHHNGKFLKPYSFKGHYPCVALGKKKKYIHRLVAEAFIQNPMDKPVVNHKDGDKLNFKSENLEWVLHEENINHCHRNGYWRASRKVILAGRKAGQRSRLFTKDQVEMIRFLSTKYTAYKITKLLLLSQNVVSRILKGKTYVK